MLYEFEKEQIVFVNGKEQEVVDVRVSPHTGLLEYKVTNHECWFPGLGIDPYFMKVLTDRERMENYQKSVELKNQQNEKNAQG